MFYMIKIKDIIELIEKWAPPGIAWERDNVGLQIGDPEKEVKGIIVALEITRSVIREALKNGCNLVITHHPLIFKPLDNLTTKSYTGSLALDLARNELNLYSAHTNLDFTGDGVNFALGDKLGLKNMRFLYQGKGKSKKINVFVPHDYVDRVAEAMAEAGAGIIGNYETCSFRINGIGTYRPLEGSDPFSGHLGKLEFAEEIRLEMILPAWKSDAVVNAMKSAHPYDEVAYDIYPNEAIDPKFGAGVIGDLGESMPPDMFIEHIKDCIGIPALRWTEGPSNMISRVAVCGGSGSDLLPEALRQKADAFITADVKYHVFHESRELIYLIDAGHYETESPILPIIVNRLKSNFPDSVVNIVQTKVNTNPITYS